MFLQKIWHVANVVLHLVRALANDNWVLETRSYWKVYGRN